jgi:hypothetical protein
MTNERLVLTDEAWAEILFRDNQKNDSCNFGRVIYVLGSFTEGLTQCCMPVVALLWDREPRHLDGVGARPYPLAALSHLRRGVL